MLRILIIIIFLLSIDVSAQQLDTIRFFFDKNSSKLDIDQERSLKALVPLLKDVKKINIHGFTDTTGSVQLNQGLSERRSAYLRDRLLHFGLNRNQISIRGYGENNPLSPKDLDLNRRAEVIFESHNIQDLYELIKDSHDEFIIDPSRDTILVSTNGSILHVPANAMNTRSGQKIRIILTEFFSKSSILANDLSTTSNGEILESGAMIHIVAVQGRDTLDLNLQKPIKIEVATREFLPDMQLFNGEREADGVLNWQLPVTGSGISGGGKLGDIRNIDTTDFMSPECNLLLSLKEDDFVEPTYSFFQRIFISRKKRDAVQEQIKIKQERRDSCLETFLSMQLVNAQNRQYSEAQQKAMEKLNTKIEESFSDPTSSKLTVSDFQQYVMNITRMGYVNVDRFLKLPGPRHSIRVMPASNSIDVKLVLKGYRSVLPFRRSGNYYVSDQIPEGIEVILVGLRYPGNGKAMVYIHEFTTSRSNAVFEMDFKPVTLEELQKELKKLDDI